MSRRCEKYPTLSVSAVVRGLFGMALINTESILHSGFVVTSNKCINCVIGGNGDLPSSETRTWFCYYAATVTSVQLKHVSAFRWTINVKVPDNMDLAEVWDLTVPNKFI